MGLGTTHGCFNGSYSGFNEWRKKVAIAAGYLVRPVEWRNGIPSETILIDWGHVDEETLFGVWDDTPVDPLMVLICHSDCEGNIYPEQAGPLADRLEELLPLLPGSDNPFRDWRQATQKWIDGLRLAAANNEAVEFH